jgi:novobiocin biosynthesis protein NovU/D-mycarose 3-C-methyltransferase
VEIASNDGTFLDAFARRGYDVSGVDPSNLADEATARGLPTRRAFFDAEVASEIHEADGPADVVLARNVIGHTDDLRGLLAGIDVLLAPSGRLIVETPYAMFLATELQYDTIFHEHVSYFTLATLRRALSSIGLRVESPSTSSQ